MRDRPCAKCSERPGNTAVITPYGVTRAMELRWLCERCRLVAEIDTARKMAGALPLLEAQLVELDG